jgi:hypothetical protein
VRAFDDIAITAEVILALDITGLPTSDRALRRHAAKNSWPIVKGDENKTLFLVEAIPEPFGPAIREALGYPPQAPHPIPSFAPSPMDAAPHSDARIMEARLAIVFEAFRRAAYIGQAEAIATLVRDVRSGNLPEYLMAAAEGASITRGPRHIIEWSDEQGSITPLRQNSLGRVVTDAAKTKRFECAERRGALQRRIVEYSLLSASTLRRWIALFNRHGAIGLLPKYR